MDITYKIEAKTDKGTTLRANDVREISVGRDQLIDWAKSEGLEIIGWTVYQIITIRRFGSFNTIVNKLEG